MLTVRRARWLVTVGALLIAACSSDNRKVLIVYSPHGKELLEYLEKGFEKAHPDIDVQWVDMGSQEVLERVRAEKPNPQADVWFGAPAEAFDRATREESAAAVQADVGGERSIRRVVKRTTTGTGRISLQR